VAGLSRDFESRHAYGLRGGLSKASRSCKVTNHAATRRRASHLDTWEDTVLAGVRNVAWGAAMVLAGLLAVILAECVWMAYFRYDAAILSGLIFCMFDICDPWTSLVELIRRDSIIGLAVVIWLIGRAVRRVSKSRSVVGSL